MGKEIGSETIELDLWKLSHELKQLTFIKHDETTTFDHHTQNVLEFLSKGFNQENYADWMQKALKDGIRSNLHLPTTNGESLEFKINCQDLPVSMLDLIKKEDRKDNTHNVSLLLAEYCFNTKMKQEDRKAIEDHMMKSIKAANGSELKPDLSFEQFMSVFHLYHQEAFWGISGVPLYNSHEIIPSIPTDPEEKEERPPTYVTKNEDGTLTLSTKYIMNVVIIGEDGRTPIKEKMAHCNLQLHCDGKLVPSITSCTLKAEQLNPNLPFNLPPKVREVVETPEKTRELFTKITTEQPEINYTPLKKRFFHRLILNGRFDRILKFFMGKNFEQAKKDALTIELATAKDTGTYLKSIPGNYQQYCVKEAMKYLCSDYTKLDPESEKMDILTPKLSVVYNQQDLLEVAASSHVARQYLSSYLAPNVKLPATTHKTQATQIEKVPAARKAPSTNITGQLEAQHTPSERSRYHF